LTRVHVLIYNKTFARYEWRFNLKSFKLGMNNIDLSVTPVTFRETNFIKNLITLSSTLCVCMYR